MKRALLLLGVLVALGTSLVGPATAANAAPTATQRLETLDAQVLAAVNETRAKHGLRPLVISDALQAAAVAHSRAMLGKGFFAHDPPGGAPFASRVRSFYRSAGYDSWTVGENLIYSTQELTADIAIAAWMASPGHRKNILTPGWREVGIGSLRASSPGGVFGSEPTWVITMDFGARSGKIVTKPTAEPKAAARKVAKSARAETSGARSDAVKQKARPTRQNKQKTSQKAKPVDRVLPRPSHDPEDDGGDDSTDASDEPATPPEDDEDDGGGGDVRDHWS